MRIDLHIHSTASDGTTHPAEIAEKAAADKIDVIALTDHDTTGGTEECRKACERMGITFIPGIEISAGGDTEIHVLGYGIDPAKMQASIAYAADDRYRRMEKIVAKLNENNVPITMEQLRAFSGGAPVGRPHAALALVKAGYASSVKEAFERWLGDGRRCFVPREKLTFSNAVEMIHACGGAAIVAHPVLIKGERRMLTQKLCGLLDAGADGIEVWHTSHTPSDMRELESFARRKGVLMTGGSDYHGESVRGVHLGQGTESWVNTSKDYEALLEKIHERA